MFASANGKLNTLSKFASASALFLRTVNSLVANKSVKPVLWSVISRVALFGERRL